MEKTCDKDQKRKKYFYVEVSRDNGAYKSSDLHLSKQCSTLVLKN